MNSLIGHNKAPRKIGYKSISVNKYCYLNLIEARDHIQKLRYQSNSTLDEKDFLKKCTIPMTIEILVEQYLLNNSVLERSINGK